MKYAIAPLRFKPIVFALLFAPLSAIPLSMPMLLESSMISRFGGFLLLVVLISYLATLFIGLPVHLALRYFGVRRLSAYLSTGFVLPVAVIFGIPVVQGDWQDISRGIRDLDFYFLLLIFGLCGAGVSGSFWFVIYRLNRWPANLTIRH